MFIDTECPKKHELRRSEMDNEDSPHIPLLRSYEDFMECADYKHYVPSGLVVYG